MDDDPAERVFLRLLSRRAVTFRPLWEVPDLTKTFFS